MKQITYEHLVPLMQEMFDAGKDVEFVPCGNSMRPLFQSGKSRVVLQKPRFPLKKYDIPFYRRPDGQYVLHRVIAVKENGYMCCGDGQITKEFPVLEDWVIATVKGYYTKRGKFLSVDGWRHRIYAFFRVLSRPVRALPKRIKRMFV